MPYPARHREKTRARIVECARELFNRNGFTEVSIDEIMARAGLTRGGFYSYFDAKEDLYAEALTAYAAQRESENPPAPERNPEIARSMVNRYVSRGHLDDLDGHCPLIALSSDVSRSGSNARAAYQQVFEGLVKVFEHNHVPDSGQSSRQQALALAATCVGAMVVSRTIEDLPLADEICDAVRRFVCDSVAPASGWAVLPATGWYNN